MKKCFITFLAIIEITFNLFGQQVEKSPDILAKKIISYGIKHAQNLIYAHFDKTVYTNNENVWFTAYLLKRESPNYAPKTLSLLMINTQNNRIAYQAKFAIDNGISFGHIFLSDSLAAGNYDMVLYTGPFVDNMPVGIFSQPVVLKSAGKGSFQVNVKVDSSAGSNPKNSTLSLNIKNNDKNSDRVVVQYALGNINHPLLTGKLTAKDGLQTIVIPNDKILPGKNILHVQVSKAKETQYKTVELPLKDKFFKVSFFPEGGYLVSGLVSKVGLEIRDNDHNPVQATAILFKNGLSIDTIQTNSFGFGRFFITPQSGAKYNLKILTDNANDTTYLLPTPLTHGVVIATGHAAANDTLTLNAAANKNGTYYFVLHNFKQAFFISPVKLNDVSRIVKFDLKDMPKGLAEVTVLDSDQRPCAERIFFAHVNQTAAVSIKTDQQEYKKRGLVTLNLKLTGVGKENNSALVSIACVQANRISSYQKNDIVNYTYLESDLGKLPVNSDWLLNPVKNEAGLEELLLIKGWRRYKWQEVADTNPTDTSLQITEPAFTGKVTYQGKKIKKPVTIGILRDSSFNTLTTDSTGRFLIDESLLLTKEEKKVHFIIAGGDKSDYDLKINDPYQKINDSLLANFYADEHQESLITENSGLLAGLDHAIQLNEVVVRGVSNNTLYATNANACGDYICLYNFLNCPIHRSSPGNHKPIPGQTYRVYGYNDGKIHTTVYQGCDVSEYTGTTAINGIFYSKEFYPEDYSAFNPPEPEYLSTIYWNHLIKLTSAEKILHFYTSDIIGPFKIIIQGISSQGVVYAEKEINVTN